MNTIFLCGFMGCGKSTVGKLLAKRLGLAFIDLDEYIEKRVCMTIPQIFEKFGEAHFRELEKAAVWELSVKSAVIACGGGAMISAKNAETAKKKGIVIFLDLPFDVCYNRINNDENRPIAAANSRQSLEELFNRRYPVYLAHSTLAVNADACPSETSERIVLAIRDAARK